MTKWGAPAAAAVAMLWCPLAQAQDMPELEPVSPWSVDYAEDSCRLIRTFGEGDDQVTLGMTAYEPGGRFFLAIVGNLTKTARSAATVRVALDEVEQFSVRYLHGDFDGRPGIVITNPISIGPVPEGAAQRMRALQLVESYSDPAVEDQVATIGFIDGFEREFALRTGSLRAPLEALKDCNKELTTHWDIDVAAHERLSRIAVPRSAPWSWLRWRSYPREMRQPMLINYRLIVNTKGRVAGCSVAGAEPDSEYAQITCDQLRKNGRFAPALNEQGKAVQSYFVWWADLRG